MSVEEFMKELEYLLSDIPQEDKADAMGYYRDYLEEAGAEHEADAIKSFGSPERIAAIIRSDLEGRLIEGGEFTDRGYEDERFKDPGYQMVKRYDLPEEVEDGPRVHDQGNRRRIHTNRTVKLVLWIILIIVASPILFGIGGGVASAVACVLGVLVVAVVIIGVLTLALFLLGIALLFTGIVTMVVSPINGVMLLGFSLLCFGFAMGFLALCGVFYGRFLPFLFRWVVNVISGIIYGRKERL